MSKPFEFSVSGLGSVTVNRMPETQEEVEQLKQGVIYEFMKHVVMKGDIYDKSRKDFAKERVWQICLKGAD